MPPRTKTKPPPMAAVPSTQSTPMDEIHTFSSYPAVVGIHSTLLAFAALFVPQSKSYIELAHQLPGVMEYSSADHPQHPFLVPITMNPLVTLLSLCAAAALLQSWWAGWLRDWHADLNFQGSAEEIQTQKIDLRRRKASTIFSAWITVLVFSLLVHFLVILFGAPIFSHVPQTYLLSLLFSVLAVFPPAYVLGAPSLSSESTARLVSRFTWTRVFAEMSIRNSAERALLYPAIGAGIGCWVGVFPVALDWDRPWQAWPLTPAYGIVTGYVIGSLAALTVTVTLHLARQGQHFAQQEQQQPFQSGRSQPKRVAT